MKPRLLDHVGPFTIRTGIVLGRWECQAVIEAAAEEVAPGCWVEEDIHCYIDHCDGSLEQAEALHADMLKLCRAQVESKS